ncbi:MAG: septal ring lytic transglycosylase RlpA family protein [Alphaproteobacteria bacterium]|nr:septal ring lytic transglycosylase RlpA family protein [Alphaproteobacteria bacterium]
MLGTKYLYLASVLLLGACAYGSVDLGDGKYTQASAITGQGGTYKIGKPYKIMGKWYYPQEDYDYSEVGTASWYGKDFHAKRTANGEKYDMYSLTAAHRTLPLPTIVKVTNLENGRSLVLRVNDRGPYAKNRIIDVSKRASQLLGFYTQGTTKVRVEVMEKESKALKAALTGEPVEDVVENENFDEVEKTAPEIVSKPKEVVSYPKGSYFVQVGSFSLESGAQSVAAQLEEDSNIYFTEVNGKNYYRVRVGPYSDEQSASMMLEKIKNRGFYNAKVVSD